MGISTDGGGIVSPPVEISPLSPKDIRAQVTSDIGKSGDSGHSGDISENSGRMKEQYKEVDLI